MSTIDPTTIDPTKPEQGEATTASVRANELATQNQLGNAKTDIEALEAGKEDAGTAASAVAAHDASGAAHGGVEAAHAAHIGDTSNPHSVTAAQAGADPTGTAAAAVAAHEAAGDPHGQYLQNVIQDTSPQLGGDLQTKGNEVHLTRADDSVQGLVGALVSSPGGYIAYSPDGTTYDPLDGALEVAPGRLAAHGAAVEVPLLKHATPGGRQVYASTDGYLYGVDPPEPGWLSSDTDTGFYARSGVGLNVWQEITGLNAVSFQQDVQSGDPVDYVGSVFTRETTGNRAGTVEIGFGINGAQPAGPAQAFYIPSNFAGFLTASARTTTVTATAGDTLGLWVRVTSQDNAQFSTGLQFDGGAGNDHELVLSVPGAGGGGGGGDVIQGNVGLDGDALIWDNAAGKVAGSAGVPFVNLARRDAANTFTALQTQSAGVDLAASGASQTGVSVDAGATTYTLSHDPHLGNLVAVTGTADVEIDHLTKTGCVLLYFGSAIGTVSAAAGIISTGVDPGNGSDGRFATLWTTQAGATSLLVWIQGQ